MAGEPLPDVELVLFTLPPDDAVVQMTLVLEEAADAPAALRRAVQDRAGDDPAWSARWTVDGVRVSGDGRLIEVTISGTAGRDAELEIVSPGELEPFRWTVPD